MKKHIIIYVLLLIYNAVMAIVLEQAYLTRVDPVTLPIIGFFFVARDLLPVAIMAAVILSFWSVLNLYGVATDADWARQSRTWGIILAVMFVLPFYASLGQNLALSLVALDPGLAYCIAEGAVILTERRT